MGNTLSTLLSIVIGAITYGISILKLNVLSKKDIMMIPFGTKIYRVLVKLHFYREEEEY